MERRGNAVGCPAASVEKRRHGVAGALPYGRIYFATATPPTGPPVGSAGPGERSHQADYAAFETTRYYHPRSGCLPRRAQSAGGAIRSERKQHHHGRARPLIPPAGAHGSGTAVHTWASRPAPTIPSSRSPAPSPISIIPPPSPPSTSPKPSNPGVWIGIIGREGQRPKQGARKLYGHRWALSQLAQQSATGIRIRCTRRRSRCAAGMPLLGYTSTHAKPPERLLALFPIKKPTAAMQGLD